MAINKVVYDGNTLIDLSDDTVIASAMTTGYTAHDRSGAQITGTRARNYDITLWTNADPTSSFAAQSITLSESAARFTYLRIVWEWNSSAGVTASNWTVSTDALAYLYDMRNAASLVEGTSRVQIGVAGRPASGYYARRCYFDDATCESLYIGAATRWATSGSNNSLLIPVLVDGVVIG